MRNLDIFSNISFKKAKKTTQISIFGIEIFPELQTFFKNFFQKHETLTKTSMLDIGIFADLNTFSNISLKNMKKIDRKNLSKLTF